MNAEVALRSVMLKDGMKPVTSPGPILPPQRNIMPESVRQIIRETAVKWGVSPYDILGKSRLHIIVRARHEALCRIRVERNFSLHRIGRIFGMDHTSVLYASDPKVREYKNSKRRNQSHVRAATTEN